jgi:AraC family transcriptional regulator
VDSACQHFQSKHHRASSCQNARWNVRLAPGRCHRRHQQCHRRPIPARRLLCAWPRVCYKTATFSTCRCLLSPLRPSPLPTAGTHEEAAWTPIDGTWQRLHGSFTREGLSIEWHDFRLARDLDWGRSFHAGSLEICLNFAGTGTLEVAGVQSALGPDQVAIYTLAAERMRAWRSANSLHRFLTLEFAPGFLRGLLDGELPKLKAPIRRFVENGQPAAPFLEIMPLSAALLASRVQFLHPPVSGPARHTWYLGRVLEILAQTVFPAEDPAELFCQKYQRTNRERVERVRYLIERDLENPPSLKMWAEGANCSPFYLSRIFTQESGVSIPKFLRMKRMEKSAELLKTGRANVTEAALAVGYASLSAFNKAFVEHFGCCPGLYPHGRIVGRAKPAALPIAVRSRARKSERPPGDD